MFEVSVKRVTDWSRALNAARMTVHKDPLDVKPSATFIDKLCRAEHSPLRLVEYDVTVKNVPYFVIMHLVRHHIGVEKFVATSREDRTGVSRDERKQTDLIDCQFSLNAQAFINISRMRLCHKADPATRELWKHVVLALESIDPILAKYCVPNCIYRGHCPEMEGCNWFNTDAAKLKHKEYLEPAKPSKQQELREYRREEYKAGMA